MPGKTQSSINLPQRISLTIMTNAEVQASNLNRYLIFRNHEDNEVKFKFTLNATGSGLHQLEITDFPDTTHDLQKLGSMNHRSYWDRIYLANPNGNTEIDIESISLTIHYVRGVAGAIRDIPLLSNVQINQVLTRGGEIFLTPYIETSVMAWAGIHPTDHPVAVRVAKDLGKSGTGSEGFDAYGDNPQYRGWLSLECSEFVSWYLHEVYNLAADYNGFTADAFKMITATQQIHDLYRNEGRSYFYHLGRNEFLSEDGNETTYTPKAGDVLVRRGNGSAEHSMIMVSWDAVSMVATVIDGPYLITLRTVDIHYWESHEDHEKDFVVCDV